VIDVRSSGPARAHGHEIDERAAGTKLKKPDIRLLALDAQAEEVAIEPERPLPVGDAQHNVIKTQDLELRHDGAPAIGRNMMREGPVRSQAVRDAFRSQAEYCRRLGSPFTASLCEVLAAGLDSSSAAGGAILGWEGDPSPLADNVPLRAVGALNALVRSQAAPYLSALYPPNPLLDTAQLSRAVFRALQEHPTQVLHFLSSPPQTNEVGRSAVLIGGFLTIALRTGLPLDLYEIGSSAGLNLLPDRYRYTLGGSDWGPRDSALHLVPGWKGPPPPADASLVIRSRRGCDASPIDLRNRSAQERLVSYVWPDQGDRIARLEAAIAIALSAPVDIDRAEAADWVEEHIELAPLAGITRVLFHSVVWSYLPGDSQSRIRAHLDRAGVAARSDAPLAWLRFELGDPPELRLTLWPSGDEALLARAHAHGTWVRWLA
jgi:hypothetical protein